MIQSTTFKFTFCFAVRVLVFVRHCLDRRIEEIFCEGGGVATPVPLSVSGSFREGRGSSRRRGSARQPSMEADEFMNLLHGSHPVKVELNRLENEVRELSEAQAEIKASRHSERLREKAVEELSEELSKVARKVVAKDSKLRHWILLRWRWRIRGSRLREGRRKFSATMAVLRNKE